MLTSGALENPIGLTLLLVLLGVVPTLVLGLTSYLKFSVVFNILKNALGAGQLPSSALITLLSLVLTLFVMAPVAKETSGDVKKYFSSRKAGSASSLSVAEISELLVYGAGPLTTFLRRHSNVRERKFFAQIYLQQINIQSKDVSSREHVGENFLAAVQESLHGRGSAPGGSARENLLAAANISAPPVIPGETFFSLVPSFVISELHDAFAIGFTIYLPFLVIDLVVANLLVGLGMMMVSPPTVSLPLKIILFVACDGWFLLCRGLLLGYI